MSYQILIFLNIHSYHYFLLFRLQLIVEWLNGCAKRLIFIVSLRLLLHCFIVPLITPIVTLFRLRLIVKWLREMSTFHFAFFIFHSINCYALRYYGPSTNAVSLRIIEAKSLLRSRVGRQHGRRVHWPCAVAYAVEAFFLYFLASKNEAAGGNRVKSRENKLKYPLAMI